MATAASAESARWSNATSISFRKTYRYWPPTRLHRSADPRCGRRPDVSSVTIAWVRLTFAWTPSRSRRARADRAASANRSAPSYSISCSCSGVAVITRDRR